MKDTLFSLFSPLLSGIREKKKVTIQGLTEGTKAFIIALFFRNLKHPFLVITETEKEAKGLYEDLCFFLTEDEVFFYPPSTLNVINPFSFERDRAMRRLMILGHLSEKRPLIIVAPVCALRQRVLPPTALEEYRETFAIGDFKTREQIVAKLLSGGYRTVSLVQERGEYSVRGHILDIYPPHTVLPLRIEFMGDEIESIRYFSPETQRSHDELTDFTLFPASDVILTEETIERGIANLKKRANELELPNSLKNKLTQALLETTETLINPLYLPLFYEGETAGLWDYLTAETLIFMDSLFDLEQAQKEIDNEIDRLIFKAKGEETFYLEKEVSLFTGAELMRGLAAFGQIHLKASSSIPAVTLETQRVDLSEGNRLFSSTEGVIHKLRPWIEGKLEEGFLTVVVSQNMPGLEKIASLLKEQNFKGTYLSPEKSLIDELIRQLGWGRLLFLEGKLSEGFTIPLWKLAIVTLDTILGEKPYKKSRFITKGHFLQSFAELREGDYVVHREFGIGLYRGLKKIAINGQENDYLLLEYQGGDKLYIPVYRLETLQRYIGPADYTPPLDRLGSTTWAATKEKVKKAIQEVARELAAIYALRQVQEGHAYSIPEGAYEEFCATFPYEETPDQVKAIEEVEADMLSSKPMDRLICGDAGFGKTEVALRAAFIAAMEAKQVAFLVPTTILAEQHYQTFSARLRNWPINVEVLNRFTPKRKITQIMEGLRRGTIDIIIGTHRLLQKDVQFKDLGLIIIDEEQRFGVIHKEKLKKLKATVDVLTLSATPIPRTLHLAMVGIKDLSVINTPPADRQPIKTYLADFDTSIIKEAIVEELKRGGQVFFLHDRIRSIYSMARYIEKLVPEAKIAIVHGRMSATEIEATMTNFIRGKTNVLVCTSIIAAGLDIPTANTIIINRADRFGLAQLYQIRGRVGRSSEEGKAYLLIPKGMLLSRDARKRLQAVLDLTEHGAGFSISYHDLEIRGGGDILGPSQSGHISAVGYELYTELMEEAIRELRGEETKAAQEKPEIHLGVTALIPEEYMPDVRHRLSTYKRISLAENERELNVIKEDLRDCFGPLPQEAENLFDIIELRNLLMGLAGKKMGYDKRNFALSFQTKTPFDPLKLLKITQKKWPRLRFTPDHQLLIPIPGLKNGEILRKAKEILLTLSSVTT